MKWGINRNLVEAWFKPSKPRPIKRRDKRGQSKPR